MTSKYDYSKDYRDTYRYLDCISNPSAGGILLSDSLTLHDLYVRGLLTGKAFLDAKEESH